MAGPSIRMALLTLGLLHLAAAQPVQAQSPSPTPPPAAAAEVQVEHFDIEGNTLLPIERIQQRIQPWLGQRTMGQLREAASAVQDLYRRAGYGGVVAFVPEQTVAGGRIRIRVVEGKLQQVEVIDNQHFSRENILASLPALQVGATPDVRRIDAQIQMANENPAKSLQLLLQPGREPGTVAAKLSVVEGPVQRWSGRLDNTGGERTGRWRAALGWQHADLTGNDDVLSTEFQTSPGHWSEVRVLSLGYRVPFYAHSMALDGFAARSDVDGGTTQTAAGDLAFSGRGRVLGLRLSRYLERFGNIDQRLQVGLEQRDYLNDCSIAGLPPGACGGAGASVRLSPLSVGYTLQAAGEYRVGLSASLAHNLGWGGTNASADAFDRVRVGAKPGYTIGRFSATLAVPLLSFGTVEARGSAQYANRALVPGEAFGVGGAQSVRGYEERELNGDRGVRASLEYGSPNLLAALPGAEKIRLQAVAFADVGWVQQVGADQCLAGRSTCRIGSLGFGLRAGIPDSQIRLDVARAMAGGNPTRKGDWMLHLLMQQSF
jgi:hemolysin activation/secretion protein